MAVTGMANLAVKVADLDAAVEYYERAGADVRDRMIWNGSERADVYLGPLMITLFTRAIYEDDVPLPDEHVDLGAYAEVGQVDSRLD